MKSDYADLLNALDTMASLPAYALRRATLRQAELLIARLERENRELRAAQAVKEDYDTQG